MRISDWSSDVCSSDLPIPEPPAPTLLSGQAPLGLWEGLAAQVESHGFTLKQVPDADAIGGANGITDFSTHEVCVRSDMDEAAQVKTLAHELGHLKLHSPTARAGHDPAPRHTGPHRGHAEVESHPNSHISGAPHTPPHPNP